MMNRRTVLLAAAIIFMSACAQPTALASPKHRDDKACSQSTGQSQIDACTRVIASNRWSGSDLAWAYGNRGGAYAKIQRFQDALPDLDTALTLDPENLGVLVNRGIAYFALERPDDSLRDLDRALNIQADPVVLGRRGAVYGMKRDFVRALADLNHALQAKPNNTEMLNNRGFVYLMNRQYELALADFDRAIALDRTDPKFFNNRAKAKQQLGDFVGADADALQGAQLERISSEP